MVIIIVEINLLLLLFYKLYLNLVIKKKIYIFIFDKFYSDLSVF